MPLLICGAGYVCGQERPVLHESQMPGSEAVWEYKGANKYVLRRDTLGKKIPPQRLLPARSACLGQVDALRYRLDLHLPLGPGLRQESKVLTPNKARRNYSSSVLSARCVHLRPPRKLSRKAEMAMSGWSDTRRMAKTQPDLRSPFLARNP